jgi:Fe2+ transport system protein B
MSNIEKLNKNLNLHIISLNEQHQEDLHNLKSELKNINDKYLNIVSLNEKHEEVILNLKSELKNLNDENQAKTLQLNCNQSNIEKLMNENKDLDHE